MAGTCQDGRYKTQVAGWNFAGWEFCRLEFCRLSGILQVDARLPGILQVDDANLKLRHYKVFWYNLILYLLQSDSLSALLISANPAAMFLASAQ